MRKRTAIIAIVGVLAAIGGGLVAWLRCSEPCEAAPTLVPEKIRIANIGIYSHYNILSAQKGFFRKEGLDAEVREYDSGATSIGALVSGNADVAVAANFVGVRRIFENSDLLILGTLSSHDVFRVLGRRDRGIEKPSDLKGKKVGVTLKTAGEFYLGKFLAAHDLKVEELEIVNMDASGLMSGIQDGTIDAAVIFEPNAQRAYQAMTGNAVVWSAQGGRREFATAYTTRAFAAAHPDVLERYLRAIVRAQDWEEANQEESKRILGDAVGYDGALVDHLWTNFIFGVHLDQELLVALEDQARWLIARGIVPAKLVPNYLEFIYFRGLETVKPSAVTIIHGR